MTLTETLRYRGAIGQWSWVLHRVSGLGVVLFLFIHIIDTSWSVFYPGLYEEAIATYQTPLFTIGEFILVACVIYHAYNGLRIAVFDFRPHLWRHQGQAAYVVIGVTLLTLVPVFALMMGHVLDFYNEDPTVLPLVDVIEAQIPFILGAVAAIVAALAYSAVTSVVAGRGKSTLKSSGAERFWWSFMRISGVLIIPLVFGHLAMMHVLQGVFELTVQGAAVVGVAAESGEVVGRIGNAINDSGTAVEFIGERWNYLLAGVAIWRFADFGLLALAVLHGFNGLRYVLTDFTMENNMLRRAAIYLCVIGVVVLLVMGAGALAGTIEETAIDMAIEAQIELGLRVE
jgi:succinate dehydrogenase / fumarate reductase, cytochrome b subunit